MRADTLSCSCAALVFVLSTSAFCQNAAVAAVVKGEDLSNVPTAYQAKVKPGALIIVKGRNGERNFEPASAMALAYSPQSDPVTVPDTDISKIANGEIGLSLFGYNPGAKLAKTTTQKYGQLNMTGTLLSGDQMLELLQKDAVTMTHVKQWLLRDYHVYIVEGVFSTVEINVTNTSGVAVKLSSGLSIGTCSATDTGAALTSVATTVPGGAASVCAETSNIAHFKTTSPTAIALNSTRYSSSQTRATPLELTTIT